MEGRNTNLTNCITKPKDMIQSGPKCCLIAFITLITVMCISLYSYDTIAVYMQNIPLNNPNTDGTVLHTIDADFNNSNKFNSVKVLNPYSSTRYNTTNSSSFRVYITMFCSGRLGNQMLQYAALFGFVNSIHHWEPFLNIARCKILTDTFSNLTIHAKHKDLSNHVTIIVDHMNDTRAFETLNNLPLDKNVTIRSSYQSHAFSLYVEEKLRREFTFQTNTAMIAKEFLKNMVPSNWINSSFIQVGIQIRRTDRITEQQKVRGYPTHPLSYFEHAMDYFNKRYPLVQFIIASDDLKWCRKNFNQSNVVFSDHKFAQDLAILSMCDHVIISVGTYSWWAGWLCKGTTIYYGVMPGEGTVMAKIYSNSKYIPVPNTKNQRWIPVI